MASNNEIDLGQLSPSQQEALQQFTQVTDQEVKDAVPLLQRSQWNVQVLTHFPLSAVPSSADIASTDSYSQVLRWRGP